MKRTLGVSILLTTVTHLRAMALRRRRGPAEAGGDGLADRLSPNPLGSQMKTKTVILAIAVLLALTSCTRPREEGVIGSMDPPGRRIVAVRTDHGDDPSDVSTDEIYLQFEDGSREYLTDNSFMERVPRFSPDNTLIAFVRRRDSNADGKVDWDDNSELWLMQLADQQSKCVTEGLPDVGAPTWHPSAHQIAFIAGEEKRDKTLYVYDVAQGTCRRIRGDASVWPTWSPDGAYIAFYDKENRVTVTTPDGDWSKNLSDDVGNGWALYWAYNNSLIFTHEKLGWQIFSPREQKLRPLPDNDNDQLKCVDQGLYDWARQGAQLEDPLDSE